MTALQLCNIDVIKSKLYGFCGDGQAVTVYCDLPSLSADSLCKKKNVDSLDKRLINILKAIDR
ncbi:hypothetical protein MASR2M29_21460 [Spirochaetota bacterium]